MPTLLLSRRYSDDSNAVWRAAVAAGWEVERLMTYAVPTGIREPVLYGETLLADAAAPALGLMLLEPTEDWPAHLPERFRKRAIRLATLEEARGLSVPAFVKPVDEKIFPARVYANGCEVEPAGDFPGTASVLISEPAKFELEVRAFVLERRIAALSAYIRGGEVARDAAGEWPLSATERQEASGFLEALLADAAVELPAAVVVDVGRTSDRGWAVVEANACWAAGLCGCDAREVLPVLRRACVVETGASADDRKWSRLEHVRSRRR
ncbi:MAG: ATP-grasp domain-containing protein [Myxococcales bacterium]